MNGSAQDIVLQNNDVLYISSIHDLQDMGHITVSGEVARPGSYVFAANTTIEDAIIQAGGLLESASIAKVDLSRRIKEPTSTDVSDTLSYTFTYTIKDGFIVGGDEVVLQPYDRIYVRKSPSYNVQNHVTVSGEVVYPDFMLSLSASPVFQTWSQKQVARQNGHTSGVQSWSAR